MAPDSQSPAGFPDPSMADADGLLAWGGNLEPATLLAAYSKGIFPWYEAGGPILWWSPDPRMVLIPGHFHCSRRLARRMRRGDMHVTRNKAFAAVMQGCADRVEGTWIHPEMMAAYQKMFDIGHAASLEVWQGDALVGGLYGVSLGRMFFAESMFSRVTDASKMALAELADIGVREKWELIDCQFHTGHLQSLGAELMPRERFMQHLERAKQ